ncbi:calcineurin-like phosphoesterase family protein [Serratia fonticola]|uniref:Calcineurin-like phosphoesterase family protein n=1 Tax=Serratia fonticola TaxID=47917 RepID=A0A542BQJ1_SERFO|nr:metallophosphoesterase [Serratia fonticola]TQI80844.1 calcineurin-like phosphoesterase family protein [Serratia fonticola]TQI97131.1 calcineurin-like phosphoesterase family protein [Serratia fonticola]TVZ71627.1 calcineurin-like phosphoesterase family protein [Serratia fonticola]
MKKTAWPFGFLFISSFLLAGCDDTHSNNDLVQPPSPTEPPITQKSEKVAFMPDVHFHDVYGTFEENAFSGLMNSKSGQPAIIRTMYAQLTSTRLFNENYFAFLAALEDAAQRGIKVIALPGDFSDDGQPIHMRGLKKVLDEYSQRYGIEFFAAPGNHDPNVPFARPGGKSDFLGEGGKEQRIYSKGAAECKGYTDTWALIDAGYELPTVCTEDIRELGYEGVTAPLAEHGFMPKPAYIYWETPYSTYSTDTYNFNTARQQADWQYRHYEICVEGTGGAYKKSDYTHCLQVPDASYLVEPIAGVWLLAIDANVYIPTSSANDAEPMNPTNFNGSGNAGYNRMLTHKTHVIEWIKTVTQRAKEQNKQLIAFSHFPMTEFYNGASDDIEALFGTGSFQMARRPAEDTAHALAQAGIQIHVGGHMHFNDTGVREYDDGFLVNIQAPSMAAYVPAYKLLTLTSESAIEVETIRLEQVPRFDELFEHYEMEHQHLAAQNSDKLWNANILSAKNYHEFNSIYLSELTRLRFLPSEWPCEMREMLFNMNGRDMLILSQLDTAVTLAQLQANPALSPVVTLAKCTVSTPNEPPSVATETIIADWDRAQIKAASLAEANNISLDDFALWSGFDLATDFYRLANAGDLALDDITPERIDQYTVLADALANIQATIDFSDKKVLDKNTVSQVFQNRFGALFAILRKLGTSLPPSDHFMINFDQREVVNLSDRQGFVE